MSATQPSKLSQLMQQRFEQERESQLSLLRAAAKKATQDRQQIAAELENFQSVISSMTVNATEPPDTFVSGNVAELLVQGFKALDAANYNFPNVDLFLDFAVWLAQHGARPVTKSGPKIHPDQQQNVTISWDVDFRLERIYGL